MVTSVHLARCTPPAAIRRARSRPREAAGLIDGQPMVLAPLTPFAYRPPRIYGHGWIGAWQDRGAFERFADRLPPEECRLLLAPVRAVGQWSAYPELPRDERPTADGRAAVLTLAHLRPSRAPAFLRASARAERDALASAAMSFATALVWPSPLTVATFSIWEDRDAMRAYVVDGGHAGATSANAQRPFHRESAFIRYEILDQQGALPALP